jgi:integrase
VILGTGAHVRCHGKGRKERLTPLTASTTATLRVWLAERAGLPTDPLFPTRNGRRLSRDAVQRRTPSTHPSPSGNARRSRRSTSRRTSCDTRPPCNSCTLASIPR